MGRTIEPFTIGEFSQLPEIIPEATQLVWMLFFVALLYAIIHAAIFVYHWYTYNISSYKFLTLTCSIYLVGTLTLLSVLFLSTIGIISSL